jgi:hypothetical protein
LNKSSERTALVDKIQRREKHWLRPKVKKTALEEKSCAENRNG